MARGKVRAPPIDAIVELAQQISVVLARHARSQSPAIAFTRITVAFGTSLRVDLRAMPEQGAITHISRSIPREHRNVSGDVSD
jgi:predicted membrane chloride channel (bestrophin family)